MGKRALHRINMLMLKIQSRSSSFSFQNADSYGRSVKVEIYLQAILSLLLVGDKNEALE